MLQANKIAAIATEQRIVRRFHVVISLAPSSHGDGNCLPFKLYIHNCI